MIIKQKFNKLVQSDDAKFLKDALQAVRSSSSLSKGFID